MEFDKLYNRTRIPVMTVPERKKSSILIVDSEPHVRQTMRQLLNTLGFGLVADAVDHAIALQKLEEREFTHVIFEAKKTRIDAKEFLRRTFDLDEDVIAIPSSYDPTVDEVFDLLIIGAKGYLVKPFTADTLDQAIVMATRGEPISEAVLHARNRNEALASLILSSLDKLTVIMRQAEQFETAKREVQSCQLGFKRAVDLGNTFAKGGTAPLVESLVELCVERSQGPATRLGRFRKRLDQKKQKQVPDAANTQATAE